MWKINSKDAADQRPAATNMHARIMALFDGSDHTGSQEFETAISRAAHEFLKDTIVTSGASIDDVSNQFLESAIPHIPVQLRDYAAHMLESVVPHAVRNGSPRCMGNMISALPHFVHPLGRLVSAMNQNLVKTEASKSLSPVERQVLAMVHRLTYGFPEDFYRDHVQRSESTLGMIVSGGTVANLMALWCARNAALAAKERSQDVERQGVSAALHTAGYRGAVIIGPSSMHYSFDKAASLLGFGTKALIRVPTDSRGRVTMGLLRRAAESARKRGDLILAIVAVAGTTDAGAIDPLAKVAAVADEFGTHFHVDATWGWPLLFSRRHQGKLTGIERAHSVSIDGHKQMYLPVGLGMLILRDPQLADAVRVHAHYTVRERSRDLGRYAFEGSRPGLTLFLHAALHLIGAAGYEYIVNENIRKAKYMASQIRARREFELLVEPNTNILLYRYNPWKTADGEVAGPENSDEFIDQVNEWLQKAQRRCGTSAVSRTHLEIMRHGKRFRVMALRAIVANPLSSTADINAVLDEQVWLAARCPLLATDKSRTAIKGI